MEEAVEVEHGEVSITQSEKGEPLARNKRMVKYDADSHNITDSCSQFPDKVVEAVKAWMKLENHKSSLHLRMPNLGQPGFGNEPIWVFEFGQWETGPRIIPMGVSVEKNANTTTLPSLVFNAVQCMSPASHKHLVILGDRIGKKAAPRNAPGRGSIILH